jgi:chlorobactene glucosyltransferase
MEQNVKADADGSFDDRENPFDSVVSLPILAARLAGAAIVVVALLSGSQPLEWVAVPMLLWTAIVVWGSHVIFAENLACLPNLSAEVPREAVPQPLPGVTIIVPARNEAAGIEPAARALAAIDYPRLEIIIVDDHSSDATPQILQRLARDFPRLHALAAPDLPKGWTGKTNANTFGFRQSSPDSRWLLFTDARVMFHRNAVSSAIAHAEANHLGLLSCVLRFEGKGLAEELLTVIQNRGVVVSARAFGGGPPASPYGLGAFTLIQRDLYKACGGHARFPGHSLEDFMLAKAAHRSGGATGAAIASEIVSIRRYHGFQDLRRRMVRTFRTAASDSVLDLVNRISLEFCLNLLPVLVVATGVFSMAARGFQPALAVITLLALLAYFAGTCTPRSCRRICGYRSWVVWLYPLGTVLWIFLLLSAISDRLRGRAISWRDRKIDAPRVAGTSRPFDDRPS